MERRKCVKCLGVLLNDKLSWRDQVQSVRKKYFMGLAKLRRLRNMLPTKKIAEGSVEDENLALVCQQTSAKLHS